MKCCWKKPWKLVRLLAWLCSSDNFDWIAALQQQLKLPSVTDVIVSLKKDCNLDEIKKVWKTLEEYVAQGVVGELGIADIEEALFR